MIFLISRDTGFKTPGKWSDLPESQIDTTLRLWEVHHAMTHVQQDVAKRERYQENCGPEQYQDRRRAYEEVAHFGPVLGLEEHGVLTMKDRPFQGPFGDIIVQRGSGPLGERGSCSTTTTLFAVRRKPTLECVFVVGGMETARESGDSEQFCSQLSIVFKRDRFIDLVMDRSIGVCAREKNRGWKKLSERTWPAVEEGMPGATRED